MEEYGGHFKMKNGNRAPCHLINMKKPVGRRKPPPAGATQSQVSCPQNDMGCLKWAQFHTVTHLSRSDDGARPQGGGCEGGDAVLGGA